MLNVAGSCLDPHQGSRQGLTKSNAALLMQINHRKAVLPHSRALPSPGAAAERSRRACDAESPLMQSGGAEKCCNR